MKFCAGLVGEKNVDVVKRALDAIGTIRSSSRGLGAGTDDPRRDWTAVEESREALERLALPENQIPKMPYVEKVFDARVMLSDLKKQLGLIRSYSQARLQLAAILASKDGMAVKRERIAKLNPKFDIQGVGPCPEQGQWSTLKQQAVGKVDAALKGMKP